MADNTTLNVGIGGDVLRSDHIGGGVKMAIAKIHNGAEGVDGGPITAANPLDVAVTPASPVATDYLPVRLTDGASFYAASGGGAGQQYAEDAIHASGDLGTMALVVRKDTAASLAGADGDYSALIVDSAGRLHVNVGNAVAVSGAVSVSNFPATQPVSIASPVAVTGTFYQATQPVSGSVSVANFPATQPVSGTFWQATQPVSAASLPLPSGAATAAKQPALGASGTPSADVLTIQGIPGGTAINASLAASELHIGNVGGHTATPSANFTRPADTTAYASGDLVANSTTAGSVTPLSFAAARVAAGSGQILKARVRKSGPTITNATFRLHLYGTSPTPSNGDNAAWLTTHSDYLGACDVVMDRAFTLFSEGIGVPTEGGSIGFVLASGTTVYGLLEARAAYAPASGETFTVELEISQD